MIWKGVNLVCTVGLNFILLILLYCEKILSCHLKDPTRDRNFMVCRRNLCYFVTCNKNFFFWNSLFLFYNGLRKQICRETWFAKGWKSEFDLRKGEHDIRKESERMYNEKWSLGNTYTLQQNFSFRIVTLHQTSFSFHSGLRKQICRKRVNLIRIKKWTRPANEWIYILKMIWES